MLEKLTETITKLQENPLETLVNVVKDTMKENSELRIQVMKPESLRLTKALVDHLNKTCDPKELEELYGDHSSLEDYIINQITGIGAKFNNEVMTISDQFVPGVKDAVDAFNIVSPEGGPEEIVKSYIAARHKQPLDIPSIENNLLSQGIIIQKQETSNKPQVIDDKKENTDTNNIETAISGSSESISEKPQLEKIIELAKSEIGTNEKDDSADKYFRELGYKHDSKDVPWCGAFVSWTLMKAGFPLPKNDLSAKSFINDEGLGHVGIKVENKIISGNYGNKVSTDTIDKINKKIVGYAIPTSSGLQIHKENIKFEKIPEGAVVVFDRKKARTQAA